MLFPLPPPGGEIGPEPVLDVLTLIISDGEAGGGAGAQAPPPPVPLHGTLPVYDLNVTLLPVNNQIPVVTLGKRLRPHTHTHTHIVGGALYDATRGGARNATPLKELNKTTLSVDAELLLDDSSCDITAGNQVRPL